MFGKCQESNESGGGNDTSPSKGHCPESKPTISFSLFVISILLGATLSYYLGRSYKTYSWKPKLIQKTEGQKEKLLASAQYRRTKIKVSEDSQQDECSPSEEWILEEIFFQDFFGRYNHENNNSENEFDDEEDEEPEDEELEGEEDGKTGAPGTTIAVDFEKLDQNFLLDHMEVRESFLNVVWDASENLDIAVLSIHCQIKVRSTCEAIMKDGNFMRFLSDPAKKQLTFDTFIAGDEDIINIISIAQQHFDIRHQGRMRYSLKLRGTRPFNGRYTNYEHDLGEILLENKNHYFHKRKIGNAQTAFQNIHVYEALSYKVQSLEGYENSLETGVDNYYTQNPDLFRPNQWLFLDGVMQSSYLGDAAYHEALVHPAMLAHSVGPKRAAIIGGGEGATLREILKHRSIEVCTMIEIDAGMIKAARDWLPWMNNCSDFSDGNCFDDKRTDLRTEDAFAWFLKRFNKDSEPPAELQTDPFDVIVMDALDPEDTANFAVNLYKDLDFWGTILNAISDDGILVMQMGISPHVSDPGEEFGRNYNRATLFDTVEAVGFKRMFLYEEGHSNFQTPWSYLVACKSEKCSEEWYLNEAEIDLRIRERILPTKSGTPGLRYVDGSTMKKYQRPSRAWQTVYCRKLHSPVECKAFLDIKNVVLQRDAFQTSFNNGMKTIIAKVNMTKGTVISSTGSLTTKQALASNKLQFGSSLINDVVFESAISALDLLKDCNITHVLIEKDFHLGKISPYLERHLYMHDMHILEQDIKEGFEIDC
mmetsp:Transcript_20017/g.30095  ORF Transcript_20017/g.30095 Transcript_20017/m.30095 type:complete len:763 (-) Transcript_20017:47-2335(-)